jgi:hypothetical protein
VRVLTRNQALLNATAQARSKPAVSIAVSASIYAFQIVTDPSGCFFIARHHGPVGPTKPTKSMGWVSDAICIHHFLKQNRAGIVVDRAIVLDENNQTGVPASIISALDARDVVGP